MINHGRGAYVDPKTKCLSKHEFSILELMMKTPAERLTSTEWADRANLGVSTQTVAGFISRLVGFDFIKSTGDSTKLLDEEKEHHKVYIFWIGDPGQPIYNRAKVILEDKGLCREIQKLGYQYGFNFWPERVQKIVTMKGIIVDLDKHRISFEFNTTDDKLVTLAELGDQKEVMINIESM